MAETRLSWTVPPGWSSFPTRGEDGKHHLSSCRVLVSSPPVRSLPVSTFLPFYHRQDFKGLDDGRVSFVGEIKKVPEGEETTKARETYLARHPGHFWVDFGEFKKK